MKKIFLIIPAALLLSGCVEKKLEEYDSRLDTLEEYAAESAAEKLAAAEAALASCVQSQARIDAFLVSLGELIDAIDGTGPGSFDSELENLTQTCDGISTRLGTIRSGISGQSSDFQTFIGQYGNLMSEISSVQTEINSVKTSVSGILTSLTSYESAYNGYIRDLNALVAEYTDAIGAYSLQVSNLQTSIANLGLQFEAIRERIESLVTSVRSISLYGATTIALNRNGRKTSFLLQPASAAAELVSQSPQSFRLEYILSSGGTATLTLPINRLECDGNGVVSFWLDFMGVSDEVRSGRRTANARLVVSGGYTDISSPFYPLEYPFN